MPRIDPVAELASKMVQKLRELRDRGEYPVTLQHLRMLVDPASIPEQVLKSVAKKAFAGQFLVALKKDLASPVSLAEDADRLAAEPAVLRLVLEKACTLKKPTATLGQLQVRLPDSLRGPFAAMLANLIATNSVPEGIGWIPSGAGGDWYLSERLPAQKLLAARLLQTLAQMQKQGTCYPPTFDELVRATNPAAPAELARAAALEKSLKKQTLFAIAKSLDGPLAFLEDAARLVEHPELPAKLVASVRTPDNQIVSLPALKRKVSKALQNAFAEKLSVHLAERNLPTGLGCLHIKKKPHFFLLSDLGVPLPSAAQPRQPLGTAKATDSASVRAVGPIHFAIRFDEAFARLDRDRGGHNLVSLAPLREALAIDRTLFDEGLENLRRKGKYILSAAEGRHGITLDERSAGIVEEGVLLLYVSQRR